MTSQSIPGRRAADGQWRTLSSAAAGAERDLMCFCTRRLGGSAAPLGAPEPWCCTFSIFFWRCSDLDEERNGKT